MNVNGGVKFCSFRKKYYEFVIIYTDSDTEKFEKFNISASIGISIYPVHGNNFEELLKNADKAMHLFERSTKDSYAIYQL